MENQSAYDQTFDVTEGNDTQTPDLQRATGQPIGGGSLVESLGSSLGGSIPPDVLMNLLQGPSASQRFGQALAGGVAFAQGKPNPVTPILEEQRRQQQGVLEMLSRLQDRADLHQDRKARIDLAAQRLKDLETARTDATTKASISVLHGILHDPAATPEALAMAQPQYATAIKKLYGFDLPASVVQRTLSDEAQNRVLADLYHGKPTDLILRNQPLLKAEDLPRYAEMLKNPAILEDLKLTTPQKLAREDLGDQLAKYKLVEAEMKAKLPKELQGDQKFAMSLEAMATKLFPGREYPDLSAKDRAQVFDAVHLQAKQEEETKARLQSQLREDVMLAGISARLQSQGQKPTNPAVVDKFVTPYKKGDELMTLMIQLKEDLKGLPDDALPQSDNYAAQKWAQLKRNTLYSGNQALFNFQQRWAPITVGALDRGYFDEKGTRAIKAFEKQLNAVDMLPTRAVMNQYLDTVQAMVQRKLLRDLDVAQNTPGYPVEALEAAKFILAPHASSAPQTQPSPLKPLVVRKQFMDLKRNVPVWVEMSPGDPIPPGYVEIK